MISRFWYHDLIGQIADCGQVSDEFNTHVLANAIGSRLQPQRGLLRSPKEESLLAGYG